MHPFFFAEKPDRNKPCETKTLPNLPYITYTPNSSPAIKLHLSVKMIITFWHYFCNFATEMEKISFLTDNSIYIIRYRKNEKDKKQDFRW